jgi:hypothetical protein
MKAEHRKEAHTNPLAHTLSQAMQGLREGPSRGTVVFVVIVALAVVLFFTWRYFAQSARESDSARWMQWDDLAAPDQAEQFLKEKDVEGSTQARLTNFLIARRSLLEGLQDLGTIGPVKPRAQENLRRAAQEYDKLADESADRPVLQQEALLGAGRAYEALGEYPTAEQKYQTLVEKFSDTARGRTAKQRLDQLKDRANSRDLQDLKNEYSKAPTPAVPPVP